MSGHITGPWEVSPGRTSKYKIQNEDGTFFNNGTNLPSWFTLDEARNIVDYDKGQRIVEHNGSSVLWEVC